MQQCTNEQVEKIVDLLKIFMKGFRDAASANFRAHGFTIAQISLMHVLHHHPNLMLNELSEKMGLSKSTVSSIVERLEKQGIVIREIPEDNRRIVRLSLSKKFMERHKDLMDVRHKLINEIFKFQALSNDDADRVINALEILTRVRG
jgi:MarR family transcriptional regulator, organic hydroperoxide resistance regulator